MKYQVIDYQTHLKDLGRYQSMFGSNRACLRKEVGTYRFRWLARIAKAMVVLQDFAHNEPYPVSHDPKIEAI